MKPKMIPRYNQAVETLRAKEYPMLQDSIYLDHAGSTLAPKSLMEAFSAELTSVIYANPHSGSWPSQLSSTRIDDIRLHTLRFFNADPSEYDVVFVANATAGIKLVLEGLRALPQGFRYAYHEACHTSIVGVREEATASVCLDDEAAGDFLDGRHDVFNTLDAGDSDSNSIPTSTNNTTLFAYSAQSHLNGTRYPMSWTTKAKSIENTYTLLDCASYCATSPLDMSSPEFAADFVVMSLYKIFGFPDLGVLLVRRSAEHIFDNRRYFGGGTVDMVVCIKESWHARKGSFLHERLEDGTLPFHNIIALGSALTVHNNLYGGMDAVAAHTNYLVHRLYDGLCDLRHGNGQPVCTMYSDNPKSSPLGTGPIVAFNLKNSHGVFLGLQEFEKISTLKRIYTRTGSACSPGGIASALKLQPWEMKENFSAGYKCGTDSMLLNGKPAGVIRASLGAISTNSDIDKFLAFIAEFFVDKLELSLPPPLPLPTSSSISNSISNQSSQLQLTNIIIYPIKSCGGFVVGKDVSWAVRPEGLAWDREWCLVHCGSGQALSQKRYPKMALLQPVLDFDKGTLCVNYNGKSRISIPLSANPNHFTKSSNTVSSRVCGDSITAKLYASDEINNFFSETLGVPCALARFPPGGLGLNSRFSKLSTNGGNVQARRSLLPGSFPDDIPSPPDSDSDNEQPRSTLLLANESPILMIHSASVDALNDDILLRGGDAVLPNSFRANLIISKIKDDGSPAQPWIEDSWNSLCIGTQNFTVLAPCRRCQMVCVDQKTGSKRQEPFLTLAKTRRVNGNVYFGMHMKHNGRSEQGGEIPMIRIGDIVVVHS